MEKNIISLTDDQLDDVLGGIGGNESIKRVTKITTACNVGLSLGARTCQECKYFDKMGLQSICTYTGV